MAINVISRYNNLLNRIRKATDEDIATLFDDVKSFYRDCNNLDSVYVKRIVDMYVEKLQQMVDDNAAAYNKKYEKLNEVKNERYDFTGEKDDTVAVQAMTLQLMGSLPKANNKANAYAINTTIDNTIKSGVVGCKAVLTLIQYPVYAEMVSERQKAKAVEGSKSDAQKAFEHAMELTQREFGKQCAELYHEGARLHRLNKRVDSFMKLVREDEANAASVVRPSFWGGDDIAGVMSMQG